MSNTKIKFYVCAKDFAKIPGTPIAYWLSQKMRNAFCNGTRLALLASPRQGFATGDNNRFLRLWHEVSLNNLGRGYNNPSQAKSSEKKWFPCNKGGGFRKWYGNNDFVANWANDGEEMKSFRGSVIRNPKYYFREGITWSTIATTKLSMRYSPVGHIFETKGSVCFSDDQEILVYLLGFANSQVVYKLLQAISPTLDYHEGPLGQLPVLVSDKEAINRNVLSCVTIAKKDWDSVEASLDFQITPFLDENIKGDRLESSWNAYCLKCNDNIETMHKMEIENNKLFIGMYGLENELSPDIPEEQITLARPSKEDDIKFFISYSIGCMMGRYSLDKEGLILADAGDTVENYLKKVGKPLDQLKFQPDEDAILPVLGDAYFEDDVTERFAKFLVATFGKDTLNENLQFIADALGIKSNESPKDCIRRYLAESFYKDHLKTYKKRPIYWLFSSGKERAFQALVYLHRYTPSTLSKMRTAYVHELQNRLTAIIADKEKTASDANASTSARNKANKERSKLLKQQAELLEFDEKLNHYASQRIALDLDEGVKVNYKRFEDILANVKDVCGKDEE